MIWSAVSSTKDSDIPFYKTNEYKNNSERK